MSKKIVKLDFTGCKHYVEIHHRIKVAFDLPDHYGCNWDAFIDMLRGEIDSERIEIYGESTLPDDWVEQLQIMHECLDIEKEQCTLKGEKFEYVIMS